MKLVVGLGNPGEKYKNTRHNLGFMALDTLIEKFQPVDKTFWDENRKLKSEIKELKAKDQKLLLIKPTTFMNLSGDAVSKVLNYYKIEPSEMIVVYDDLDLPFGKIRIRFGGGAGGHHGVESIIEKIKSDKFLRIRMGIGSPRRIKDKEVKSRNYKEVDSHVLGPIGSSERGKVRTMLKQVVRDVELILEHGIGKYMSKYNK